jgi:hypothetical protein
MPIGAKRPISDSGHAKPPDFSIPVPAAKHHDAAARHYEEAARHHRQAAEHYKSGHHEKASHHAHLAYAHHLHAEQHAEEAAKAHIKNYLDDSHELAKETHNKSGRIETFSEE